jgi:hypothetical protein
MNSDHNVPHDGAAENGPRPEFWPSDYRALDLQYFVKAIHSLRHDYYDVDFDDGVAMHTLVVSVRHLFDDLIAWAEGEQAKLKD